MKKLFRKLQIRFTKWYIRKGYDIDYDFGTKRVVWKCPFWVKPLLMLFSPSIYAAEAWGKAFMDGFIKGMAGYENSHIGGGSD